MTVSTGKNNLNFILQQFRKDEKSNGETHRILESKRGNRKRTQGRKRLKIKEGLEALVGIVPGLLKAEVGIGIPENGWDLCLYTEFDNKEHLTAYRDHPAHKKVQEFVHQVITERVACDYVI